MKQFWMVYVKGGRNPAHEHATRALAREEAARLCRKEGKPAYVLEATEVCSGGDVTWSILEEPDENDPGAGDSALRCPRMCAPVTLALGSGRGEWYRADCLKSSTGITAYHSDKDMALGIALILPVDIYPCLLYS